MNLWSANHPNRFWQCQADLSADQWDTAAQAAIPALGLPLDSCTTDELMAGILGESQFGSDHWQLSPAKCLYYDLKPFLPRALIRVLRRVSHTVRRNGFPLGWPIEPRYAAFQWSVMKELLRTTQQPALPFIGFWPQRYQYAFVLTHDVETAEGQEFVRAVADLETRHGFRSSFNFVPERYALDWGLISELRERGFEIGLHGLRHDGRDMISYDQFTKRAPRIKYYLSEINAVGFRAPLTLRNPYWLQELPIEYDASFFDTDPFEPIPGGTMSIWPFQIGRFIELPYTLAQDHTLTKVLGETAPALWLDKVNFIEAYHGMVLVITHPDYLQDRVGWAVYDSFLNEMKIRSGYWHALPREVARWWRARAQAHSVDDLRNAVMACAHLEGDDLVID